MSSSFEIMYMLGQAKQYIDKAYEMLKEEKGLETETMSKTNYAKWNTREHMIFGEDYKPENYGPRGSTVRRFKGMGIVAAEALITQGFLDPEERQNDSPTVREFIDFAKDHLDANFRFHGYVVGPEREDCRVSIEGIQSGYDDINKETILDFVKMFMVNYPANDTDVRYDNLYCWYD